MKHPLCLFVFALCVGSLAAAQAPKAGDIVLESTEYAPSSGDPVPAELGYLWVPANRSRPDSELYKLGFIRFRSTSPNPGSPIVYLAG